MPDHPELLRLPVWEPAGRDVVLSEPDLLQHLLVIGATGSGKSCLLHRVTDQLIAHEAHSQERKPGLLIFDAKVDDTVERVRKLAIAAGREKDLVVLPSEQHFVDLFGSLRGGLRNVEVTTRRLLLGTGSMCRDNAYWDETRYALIEAALTLLLLGPEPVNFNNGIALMREWFFGADRQSRRLKNAVETMIERLPELNAAEGRKVAQTLDTVSLFKGLDPRTLSNVLSTLMVTLRPILTVPASHCFEPRGRTAFDVGTIATKGRICVVSLSALNEPGLASLFFKVVKADFFRAVHERGDRQGRLAGIIADELPLLATATADGSDEAGALATVRSRRCFIAAASQGIALLAEKLGTRVCKSMLGNFGTIIFLRNREEETDLFAAVHLGAVERTVNLPLLPPPEAGDLQLLPLPRLKFRSTRLVCPPGTLGRLAPHQGFVALPDQPPHDFPLSFVPWFEATGTRSAATLVDPASTEHLRQLMRQQGYELQMDPVALKAALKLCSLEIDRTQVLEETTTFFRGRATMIPRNLDTLPTPWLKGLPGILRSQRKDHWTLAR
jgi:hypothetical protein